MQEGPAMFLWSLGHENVVVGQDSLFLSWDIVILRPPPPAPASPGQGVTSGLLTGEGK